MNKIVSILILGFGISVNAYADVWKWVDANGDTHYVDSKTAIYTWLDENGRAHYSDTPDHYSAVLVKLLWHSPGALPGAAQTAASAPAAKRKKHVPIDETEAERHEREQAESYYCKRATEIYESYLTAPRLYDTDADGNRVYLSASDGEKLLAETKTKVDALCS